MSQFTEELSLRQIGERLWVVTRAFDYHVGHEGSNDIIHIPKDRATDLASIPRIFWSVLPPYGMYSQAAVVHDDLYWNLSRPRKEADKIFLEAMEVLKVKKWKRKMMYRAVRSFGWIPWKKRVKEQAKYGANARKTR